MCASGRINFCEINLPKAFGFVWIKRKDYIEKPVLKREVMNRADGVCSLPGPPGVGVSKPQIERDSRSSSCAGPLWYPRDTV